MELKICLFADTFFPLVGGAETVLHNLATHLTRRGVLAVVLAPRVRGKENRFEAEYPVYRYPKPSSKRFGVRQVLLPLARLQIRHRFDLLHCHAAYPPAHAGRTFKRIFRVPLVVRPHGSDVLANGRIRANPRLEKRLRRALGAADAVVAQGDFLAGVIRDLGVERERIRVIHNGVDLDAFASAPRFEHPRPYAFAIGNLTRRKGFDLLLRGYARLEDPRLDLLIAGGGVERPALESLAADLGIRPRVRFLGHVSGGEKASAYRSAEFLVVPSREEPFANVILEGLAAGLPVVASAVGGNPELVRDGEHGILVPPEDPGALARAMERLAGDPGARETFRRAIPRFIADFGWNRVAGQYLDLYRELTERA